METDMETRDIGQRIAKLRKEKGYSQVELARKLNVSDKTVSKWENGGMPSIDLFPALANLLEVSIDYLMTGNPKDAPTEEKATINVIEENTVEETPAVEQPTVQKPAVRLRPQKCTCAKCGKVNYNPTDHCTFCYHTFTRNELLGITEEEEEVEIKVEAEILPETLPYNFICPKCGKVNDIPGENCSFCYHSFSAYTRKGAKTAEKKSSYNDSYTKKYSQKQSTASSTTNYVIVNQQNTAGCLAYIIAFFFPLVGLIWGAVQKEKGLVIFSIVWGILFFFISMLFSALGLLFL